MSALAKWEVRGPVKNVEKSHARWESATNAWTETGLVEFAWFRPDGKLSKTEFINPDGSVYSCEWHYDETGRVTDLLSGMREGTSTQTRHIYDDAGRHVKTIVIQADGSVVDSETYAYDDSGKKTRTKFLRNSRSDLFRHIEGAQTSVGAAGATAMSTTYDENDLPSEVRFLGEDGKILRSVTLLHNEAGRLIEEEVSVDGGGLPFRSAQSDAHQKALEAAMSQIFANNFSSTTYDYDDRGRLIERKHSMGTLGGDRTTYRYEDHGAPVEEVTEHITREASIGEDGALSYRPNGSHVQHFRFEYIHDGHGNWISKTVWSRPETEPEFQPVDICRRQVDYYTA